MSAAPSTFYSNYISINPADILANHTLTYDKLGSMSENWTQASGQSNAPTGGAVVSQTTTDGHYTFTVNTSAATGNVEAYHTQVLLSNFPSDNPSYDYLTVIYGLTGQAMTGVNACVLLDNGSANHQLSLLTPGQISYQSISLAQFQKSSNYAVTFNTSGKGATNQLMILYYLSLPKTTIAADYTFTVYGLAFTDYPLTLGQNATGATISQSGNSAKLSTLDPDFAWQAITDNGYTAAVSQPLQNLTTQQSAINTLNYIEQVEYQGQFNLPTAPDISYGAANLTEHFNVSTLQTQVLDINGVSYLSTISGKNNTIQLLSSVNPNGQTQFLQIVDYTQSQWTSISSPPGIFTLAGIEYYWEEFIIAILAIVGVGGGAAARHASNLRKVK